MDVYSQSGENNRSKSRVTIYGRIIIASLLLCSCTSISKHYWDKIDREDACYKINDKFERQDCLNNAWDG